MYPANANTMTHPHPTHTPYQAVRRLGVNAAGRDFVVGDIHGAFDLVLEAMEEARFDPAVDRLFAVGDLIDRGPGSHRCARFLAQPYVHVVRGNHENMLLELYEPGVPSEEVVAAACRLGGMHWWLDVGPRERQAILMAFSTLPLAIEVQTRRGTVGLIHADVPAGMHWDTFLALLQEGDSHTVQTCLWGRSRIRSGDDSGVPGVGRVFVGHTPQWGGVGRLGNVFAVDTGGVFGHLGTHPDGHLTMANFLMKSEALAAPRSEERRLRLVELKDDGIEPSVPFCGAPAARGAEARNPRRKA